MLNLFQVFVVRKDTEIKTQIKQQEGHRRLNKGKSPLFKGPLNHFASCSFIKVQFEMLDIQMQVQSDDQVNQKIMNTPEEVK